MHDYSICTDAIDAIYTYEQGCAKKCEYGFVHPIQKLKNVKFESCSGYGRYEIADRSVCLRHTETLLTLVAPCKSCKQYFNIWARAMSDLATRKYLNYRALTFNFYCQKCEHRFDCNPDYWGPHVLIAQCYVCRNYVPEWKLNYADDVDKKGDKDASKSLNNGRMQGFSLEYTCSCCYPKIKKLRVRAIHYYENRKILASLKEKINAKANTNLKNIWAVEELSLLGRDENRKQGNPSRRGPQSSQAGRTDKRIFLRRSKSGAPAS